MKKKLLISLLSILLLDISLGFADPSSVGLNDPPTGEPIQIELLVIMALVAFILFKIFGVGKVKEPPVFIPPPVIPKQKPLLKQVSDAIGGMQEVGDKTYAGGKMVKKQGDIETYLVMAQVDKSDIRRQERAAAQEEYERYEKTIFYLKIVVGLFIVFILAITHETLIGWGKAIYEFIVGLTSSGATDAATGAETTPN